MITAWFGSIDPVSGDVISEKGRSQMVDCLMKISPDEMAPSPLGPGPSSGPGILPQPNQPSQPDLRALALDAGIFRDDIEYNKSLREVALDLVKRKLKDQANAEAELLQTIEALDDLNEVINRLDERVYEWSRLHTNSRLRGKRLAESLEGEGSLGEMARTDLELRNTRERVQRSLEVAVSQMSPNLSELAGPLLAARLISRAGSSKRLSEMPASAIQVMGAEKALFKHLKGKAPSPKHGMIYRHSAIQGVTPKLRGRAARALAAKLAIAARIDHYSGELNPDLKRSLDKRIEEIRRSGRKKAAKGGKRGKKRS